MKMEWVRFDQSTVDATVSQLRRRLSACVRVRRQTPNFEHRFWPFWNRLLCIL